METRILVTRGPSSLNRDTVKEMARLGVYPFRTNLSCTPLRAVAGTIRTIQSWSAVPVCVDSEGARIRNQRVADPPITFVEGDICEALPHAALTPAACAPVGSRMRGGFRGGS